MEIVVALLGLVGAVVGLLTAILSRRQEVVLRHETSEKGFRGVPGPAAERSSPGATAFRSTLVGFAIGTFFGVTILSAVLIAIKDWSAFERGPFVTAGVIGLMLSGVIGTVAGLRTGMRLAELSTRGERRQETYSA